jgi:hypothetical protein
MPRTVSRAALWFVVVDAPVLAELYDPLCRVEPCWGVGRAGERAFRVVSFGPDGAEFVEVTHG